MFKILTLSLLLVSSVAFNGQAPAAEIENPLNSEKSTLKSQHDFIMEQSRTYVNNKVVKIEWINKFYLNALDSLELTRSTSNSFETSLLNERGELKDALEALTDTEENLAEIQEEKDNITLFGSPTSKGAYKTTMWVIIITILALLLFFMFKFKKNNGITKDAKEKLDDIELELEEIKKKSRIKEQELMRKLQDEINKNS